MTKKNIFIAIILLLVLYILFGQGNTKKINWFPTYYYKHKIPYGTYVYYKLIHKNLTNPITNVDLTPFQFFRNNTIDSANYILYNSQLNLGETNIKSLLNWVKKGNKLFIFTNNIDKGLQDSLHIKLTHFIDLKNDSIWLFNFTHPSLKISHPLSFERPHMAFTVIKPDSSAYMPYKKLGTINDSLVNFALFNYGKGEIYLHTTPEVLTNYFILSKNNYLYTEGILSYLNNTNPIYLDTHYQNGSGNDGIFKVLLNTPAFFWAYRLLLVGILLFLLFEGKRKQRPIPIVKPPVNETLNFIQTVSYMFIRKKEHKEMADKRISIFMDWLKNTLYLDINKPQDELIREIETRTKLKKEDIKAIFNKINEVKSKEKIKAKEVVELETVLNKIQHGI